MCSRRNLTLQLFQLCDGCEDGDDSEALADYCLSCMFPELSEKALIEPSSAAEGPQPVPELSEEDSKDVFVAYLSAEKLDKHWPAYWKALQNFGTAFLSTVWGAVDDCTDLTQASWEPIACAEPECSTAIEALDCEPVLPSEQTLNEDSILESLTISACGLSDSDADVGNDSSSPYGRHSPNLAGIPAPKQHADFDVASVIAKAGLREHAREPVEQDSGTSSKQSNGDEENSIDLEGAPPSLRMLCEAFPGMPVNKVAAALKRCQSDADATLDYLFSIQIEEKDRQQAKAEAAFDDGLKATVLKHSSTLMYEEDKFTKHRPAMNLIIQDKGKNSKTRYLNGSVVSIKGERFVDVSKKEQDPSTFVALKVKTKGKRGPGYR